MKNHRRLLCQSAAVTGLAAGVLALAGCTTPASDTRKPVPPKMDAAFANGRQADVTATAPVAVEWWRGFHDPTLDALVGQSLRSNQDLRIALARIQETRALYGVAVLSAFPIVTANGGYTHGLNSEAAQPGYSHEQRKYDLYNAGFDATWELDFFGRVRAGIKAADAEIALTEANLHDVQITLAAEVARNYFELRGNQQRLAVARRSAENQRENLEMTQAKLEAGTATEFDVSRAKTQLHNTLALTPPLEAAIQHAIHRLGVLTGQPPTTLGTTLTPPAPVPAVPELVAIGDPAGLLRRRPDIRAAEEALAATNALVDMSTADLFPRVYFNGTFGVEATKFPNLGRNGATTYSFGPHLSWAALDLGRVRDRIRASNAAADADLARYEKTVLNALEETENALVDFDRERARCRYLVTAAEAAEQSVTLARQRYEGGIADFLSVLDAERSQLTIQEELVTSKTRTNTHLVALYKALGGGWEAKPVPPPAAPAAPQK
ncbi:MAG: efflux transporter outer membrane subunit [Lentisphaeria bacterium]